MKPRLVHDVPGAPGAPVTPDRVVLISLGVRGRDNEGQVRAALLALRRAGFQAGPTSDEALRLMADRMENR